MSGMSGVNLHRRRSSSSGARSALNIIIPLSSTASAHNSPLQTPEATIPSNEVTSKSTGAIPKLFKRSRTRKRKSLSPQRLLTPAEMFRYDMTHIPPYVQPVTPPSLTSSQEEAKSFDEMFEEALERLRLERGIRDFRCARSSSLPSISSKEACEDEFEKSPKDEETLEKDLPPYRPPLGHAQSCKTIMQEYSPVGIPVVRTNSDRSDKCIKKEQISQRKSTQEHNVSPNSLLKRSSKSLTSVHTLGLPQRESFRPPPPYTPPGKVASAHSLQNITSSIRPQISNSENSATSIPRKPPPPYTPPGQVGSNLSPSRMNSSTDHALSRQATPVSSKPPPSRVMSDHFTNPTTVQNQKGIIDVNSPPSNQIIRSSSPPKSTLEVLPQSEISKLQTSPPPYTSCDENLTAKSPNTISLEVAPQIKTTPKVENLATSYILPAQANIPPCSQGMETHLHKSFGQNIWPDTNSLEFLSKVTIPTSETPPPPCSLPASVWPLQIPPQNEVTTCEGPSPINSSHQAFAYEALSRSFTLNIDLQSVETNVHQATSYNPNDQNIPQSTATNTHRPSLSYSISDQNFSAEHITLHTLSLFSETGVQKSPPPYTFRNQNINDEFPSSNSRPYLSQRTGNSNKLPQPYASIAVNTSADSLLEVVPKCLAHLNKPSPTYTTSDSSNYTISINSHISPPLDFPLNCPGDFIGDKRVVSQQNLPETRKSILLYTSSENDSTKVGINEIPIGKDNTIQEFRHSSSPNVSLEQNVAPLNSSVTIFNNQKSSLAYNPRDQGDITLIQQNITPDKGQKMSQSPFSGVTLPSNCPGENNNANSWLLGNDNSAYQTTSGDIRCPVHNISVNPNYDLGEMEMISPLLSQNIAQFPTQDIDTQETAFMPPNSPAYPSFTTMHRETVLVTPKKQSLNYEYTDIDTSSQIINLNNDLESIKISETPYKPPPPYDIAINQITSTNIKIPFGFDLIKVTQNTALSPQDMFNSSESSDHTMSSKALNESNFLSIAISSSTPCRSKPALTKTTNSQESTYRLFPYCSQPMNTSDSSDQCDLKILHSAQTKSSCSNLQSSSMVFTEPSNDSDKISPSYKFSASVNIDDFDLKYKSDSNLLSGASDLKYRSDSNLLSEASKAPLSIISHDTSIQKYFHHKQTTDSIDHIELPNLTESSSEGPFITVTKATCSDDTDFHPCLKSQSERAKTATVSNNPSGCTDCEFKTPNLVENTSSESDDLFSESSASPDKGKKSRFKFFKIYKYNKREPRTPNRSTLSLLTLPLHLKTVSPSPTEKKDKQYGRKKKCKVNVYNIPSGKITKEYRYIPQLSPSTTSKDGSPSNPSCNYNRLDRPIAEPTESELPLCLRELIDSAETLSAAFQAIGDCSPRVSTAFKLVALECTNTAERGFPLASLVLQNSAFCTTTLNYMSQFIELTKTHPFSRRELDDRVKPLFSAVGTVSSVSAMIVKNCTDLQQFYSKQLSTTGIEYASTDNLSNALLKQFIDTCETFQSLIGELAVANENFKRAYHTFMDIVKHRGYDEILSIHAIEESLGENETIEQTISEVFEITSFRKTLSAMGKRFSDVKKLFKKS